MSSRLAVLVLVAVASCLQAHGRDLSTPHDVVVPPVELVRHKDTTVVAPSSKNEDWLCNTIVEVKTGDYWRSGTDSVITITLSDKSGTSYEFSSGSGGSLEQGSVDVYTSSKDYPCPFFSGIGFRPCILKIVSDGTGLSPDWFCEYVDVTIAELADETRDIPIVFYGTHFRPNQWIGPHSDRMSVEINQCDSSMAVA